MKAFVHFQVNPKNDDFEGARLRKTIKSALEMNNIPYTDTLMDDFDVAHFMSIVTLHLTINEKYMVDTTAVACESFTWYGKEYTASGDYDTTFIATTGCDSTVKLHLTIHDKITVDTTAIACKSFTWYGEEYTGSGDYEKTFTTVAGCDSTVKLHLTISDKFTADTTAI